MSVKRDAVTLKGKNSRMSWVPKQINLTRSEGVPMHTHANGATGRDMGPNAMAMPTETVRTMGHYTHGCDGHDRQPKH